MTGPPVGGVVETVVLELGEVQLPDWHPRSADETCVIRAFAIRHPGGVVLFDTGVGEGNALIEELYKPTVTSVVDALNGAGIDERDVVAIVNSHLHFDHCGQNSLFPSVPVYVQRAELEAAELPHYTVPEWAHIEPGRQRVLDGDDEIVAGVRILATPGHTPGHQSLLVSTADGRGELMAGQCCYSCAEFVDGIVARGNVHDDEHVAINADTLARLRSLDIAAAHFSHDRTVYQPGKDTGGTCSKPRTVSPVTILQAGRRR